MNIYTLSHCKYCKWLLTELDQRGILYKNIDANDHIDLADMVERLIDTNAYPIVHIPKGGVNLYFASESGPKHLSSPSFKITVYSSVTHLLELIKQHI
jgi:glutaredoxin